MNIIGYRGNPTKSKTAKIFQKHTTLPQSEINKIVNDIMDGVCRKVDNDWVLREDLEEYGFIID